jgi:uncharacterized membrane protein
MSELVVVTYSDINRAAEVLLTLKRLEKEHLIDLEDAVYVTKGADGKAKLHQSVPLGAIGASSGLVRGTMKSTPDKVLPEVSQYGGKILRSSLSNEQEKKLQEALDAGAASAAASTGAAVQPPVAAGA